MRIAPRLVPTWAVLASLAPHRLPAPRLCAVDPPPRDLDIVCEQARSGLRDALLQGNRGLTIETSMGSLDVTSRAYEPPVLARFALEISRALTVIEGEVLLLLPGTTAVMEARTLLDKEIGWPKDERDRLSVSSLAMQGGPDKAADASGAVVLVGVTHATDVDDPSYRNARAWMASGRVAVCINAKLDMPPREMYGFEAAYCLMTYTVARTDTSREDANLYQEDAGSACLQRVFPQKWVLKVDLGNTGGWTLVDELKARPDEEELAKLLLPSAKSRQSALDAVRNAVPDDVSSGRNQAPARGNGGSGDGAADGAGNRDTSGVVTINWEAIQAPGSFGPLTLYGALALHRIRTLGGEACSEPDKDARGLHAILTENESDAASAWEPKFGKLRAGLTAACQIVPDGVAPGVASLEQIAIKGDKADASSGDGGEAEVIDGAKAVISRAISEAKAANQQAILAMAPVPRAGSYAEAALTQLGFATSPAPGDVALAAAMGDAPGAMWLPLSDAPPPARGGGGSSEADDEPQEADSPRAADVAAEATGGEGEAQGDGGVDESQAEGEDEESSPGASAEDIERLKRMFGGDLGS